MNITQQHRKDKGLLIAQTNRITNTPKGWKVSSQSGNGTYTVISNGFEAKCNCQDYETRHCKCKHIWAVEFIVTQQVDTNSDVDRTSTLKKTYKQNWHAYDTAQINEKSTFLYLLKDIISTVDQPLYDFGRPTLQLSDLIYSSILKIYTTFSLRRFMSDITSAKDTGYIENVPSYSSIGHFMQREDITTILTDIGTLTSKPLKDIESNFAIDSTGFGTSNFQ